MIYFKHDLYDNKIELIAIGFADAIKCCKSIYGKLNPGHKGGVIYSTNNPLFSS